MRQERIPTCTLLYVGVAALMLMAGCETSDPRQNDADAATEENVARSEVERGPLRVVLEVSPQRARLSDEPTLTLTLDAAEGVEIHEPPFGEALGAFLIRDFQKPLPKVEDGREIRRFIYTLEPTEAGTLTIDPISVSFVDARSGGDGEEHTLRTEPLTIHVSTEVEGESQSLADLRPAAPPVPLPETTAAVVWWWLGGGGLALVMLGLLMWSFRRKSSEAQVPTLSPRERARHELARLQREDLARRNIKLFYVELTGIVRRFIEDTTGVHAPEQTTEEFLREIQHNRAFTLEERQRLQEFLESADLVKFAAFEPRPEDTDMSLQAAERFVAWETQEVAA